MMSLRLGLHGSLGALHLKAKPAWQVVCSEAEKLINPSSKAIVEYFKRILSSIARQMLMAQRQD
jgi:hypothetical protein